VRSTVAELESMGAFTPLGNSLAILDVLRGVTSLRATGPRTASFTFSLSQAMARTPAAQRAALAHAIHTTGSASVHEYGSVALDPSGRVRSLSVVISGVGGSTGLFLGYSISITAVGAPVSVTPRQRHHRHMSEPAPLHPTAQRYQQLLHDRGLDVTVRMLPGSARTAVQAAESIGVQVGQIVKSLVFLRDQDPVLVLCAGDRRVDADRLGLVSARADRVRELTGFAIGGIPPLGHAQPLPTLIDASLRRFDVVWAAAGHPHAVFPIALPALIAAVPEATVTDV
jgi:prolyl-tRNA editing enzyme YbaK/EbsC (Cys-tRNA(Pro) deacylase)